MLYGRPVWQLMRDCAAALDPPFRASEVVGWFRRHYPDVNEGTVRLHLHGLTANVPARASNMPWLATKKPLFWRIDHGLYDHYDPARHGGHPAASAETAGFGERVTATSRHEPPPSSEEARRADIVLVGCVKTKGREAAPARDLFRSDLFIKRRSYAEALRVPWYVLSARFGLLHPDDVIGPYDVYLGDQPAAYRNAWGTWVAAQLQSLHDLKGQSIEVHAGEDYVAPLREPLQKAGASLVTPLAGLRRGEQLSWYVPKHGDYQLSAKPAPSPTVDDLVARLTDRGAALRPSELLERGSDGLQCPGLYSWWVDAEGAQELTAGLAHPVDPGLLYVGQAGATRSRSGQPSSNTLWLRLTTMHLGGRAEMSTLRRALAAALAPVLGLADEDDPLLSAWIARHMSVVAVPIQDVDTLAQTESAILQRLDPPFNIRGLPHTPIREDLKRRRSSRNG